jgi:bile acid:Na+ symporter, BASS family
MAWILSRTILIPIGLGVAIRGIFPRFADRSAPVLGKAGTVGLAGVVLFALVAYYPSLLKLDAWSYAVTVTLSAVAVAIGHLTGPRNRHERTITTVECGVRHPLLAITIGAANFTPQKALPVLVPCVLTFMAVAMVYLFWRGRSR